MNAWVFAPAILIFVIFWMLVIRPQRREQNASPISSSQLWQEVQKRRNQRETVFVLIALAALILMEAKFGIFGHMWDSLKKALRH